MNANSSDPRLQENFSLVLGGPLYQLYLRSRLLKPAVDLVERRVIAIIEYTDEFRSKWMSGKPPAEERLIGSADIQSLADPGNAFEVVRGMRLLPIDRQGLVMLAVAIALPFAPLLLTMFPVDKLITGLVAKIF